MVEDIKNEVLLVALQEKYSSIAAMRERIQSITLRLMWILLAVSGWLLQTTLKFKCNEKIYILVVILISMIIFYNYFENLKSWVIDQRDTVSKIEHKLWFFNGNDSIYPNKRNEKNKDWPFLEHHYSMLIFGYIVLIISIIYLT